MKPYIRLIALIFILTLLVSACNVPKVLSDEEKQQTVDAIAQKTISALDTEAASHPSPTPQTPTITNTPVNTNTPLPNTVTPSITPTPTTTAVCNKASFVTDVTALDGEVFPPNTTFTKTWRLKNTGTCTWTTSYAVVFDSGDNAMGYSSPVFLTGNVPPNSTVDLSVNLKSPNTAGAYTANFKLRDGAGVLFGLGSSATSPFWVKINVAAPGTFKAFDFIAHACDAAWTSTAGSLPCPGTNTDDKGFVLTVTNPKWETGATDDEAALETHPSWVDDGMIVGKYPAFDVKSGDRFKAVLGCMYNGLSCDVRFFLNYQIGAGPETNLDSWLQTYDGTLTSVDIDLSTLAGNSVKFILRVSANGPSGQDWALWLQPRIMR